MEQYVKMPSFGEEVEEVEISEWYVKPGDIIDGEMPLGEVLVDKAAMELTSEYTGKVVKILKDTGSIVSIGEEILLIES
jgi:pyruvate/2-oxoglutarate dehydrogenase complex dihydrolipoamide acyltransferase (E2) component